LNSTGASFSLNICQSPNYFYEALSFIVPVEGHYRFWSLSPINTRGDLYKDDFDPGSPSKHRLVSNNIGCSEGQFLLYYFLRIQVKYILVVATPLPSPYITGNLSIVAAGPANVDFTPLGEPIETERPSS
jgi:hypothetical protein